MTEIRNHDVVKVKSTNKISRIIDIHYAFDRYQIKGVSGWQYGIKDLEKLNTDSLITTIESQKEICKLYDQAVSVVKQQANVIELKEQNYRKLFSEFQSQKEEIEHWKVEYEALKGVGELHLEQIESLSEQPSNARKLEIAVHGFRQILQYAPLGSASYNVAVSAIEQIRKEISK